MPIIEAKNLEKTYDGEAGTASTQALTGATLNIEEGEFVAIMGPSGSGKSTLLHILGFLDKQSEGTYKFNGNAIEELGLSHRTHHLAAQLSGGEKQRAAIARALVMKPKVIFADEPTGNLDSRSGQAVMKIIQDLNENRGHTIVLITHETYTAEHAQRIIRLKVLEI